MSKEPTITYRDFTNGLGEPVMAFTVYCNSHAEREARVAMERQMPVAQAFVPNGGKQEPKQGTPFDPPEVPRYPPPNCDGNNTAGDVLAQAQYEAAVDGAECTSGVCLAVRGAND